MSRTFRVSKDKKEEIKKSYIKYGCTKEEAEYYSSHVFDYNLTVEEQSVFPNAWEIECQSENVPKIERVNRKNQNYVSWLKGGWSRSGYWEKGIENTVDLKCGTGMPVRPQYKRNIEIGNSLSYWNYMKKNERNVEQQFLNPQDFVFVSETDSINRTRMKKIPIEIGACADNEYLHLSVQVVERANKSKKRVNHVFAVDVSGSMGCRLILVQLSMVALFHSLNETDTVTILTYSENCQLVDEYIPANDSLRFQRAISDIKIAGGYGRNSHILQVAYAILNREGKKGILTMFTDGVPNSGFETTILQNAYIHQQLLFGNKINIFAFGSDAWRNPELQELVCSGGGRLRAILEPSNIRRVIREKWENFGEYIYDVNIKLESEEKISLLGVSPEEKYNLDYLEMTDGTFMEITFKGISTIHLKKINIQITWKDASEKKHAENIEIPIQAAAQYLREQLCFVKNLYSI